MNLIFIYTNSKTKSDDICKRVNDDLRIIDNKDIENLTFNEGINSQYIYLFVLKNFYLLKVIS